MLHRCMFKRKEDEKAWTLTQSFTRVYTDPGLKKKGLKVGVQTLSQLQKPYQRILSLATVDICKSRNRKTCEY